MEEILALANIWLFDLGGTTVENFKEAVQGHRKESRYFPTIHDIFQQLEVIHDRVKREISFAKTELIGENPDVTDEEVAEHLKNIRKAMKGVGG